MISVTFLISSAYHMMLFLVSRQKTSFKIKYVCIFKKNKHLIETETNITDNLWLIRCTCVILRKKERYKQRFIKKIKNNI